LSIGKFPIETGEELTEPVEVGPYRAVETELVDEQGNTRRVRGHLVVRGVGRQVRRQLIEYGVRDMFAGAPEEVKPVLRTLSTSTSRTIWSALSSLPPRSWQASF